jgi:hypothetical protein
MDQQTRRFVNDHNVIVFKYHLDWNRLGNERRIRREGNPNLHEVSSLNFVPRSQLVVVNQDETARYGLPQDKAAHLRKLSGQEMVKPHPVVLLTDLKICVDHGV